MEVNDENEMDRGAVPQVSSNKGKERVSREKGQLVKALNNMKVKVGRLSVNPAWQRTGE